MKNKYPEFIPLYTDWLFKILFGTKKNKEFLQDLLESYFNLDSGSLKGLKIINSFVLTKASLFQRKYELDIKVELPNGELIDLEMQNIYDESAEIRIFIYLNGLAYTQLKKGQDPLEYKSTTSIVLTRDLIIHDIKQPYQKYCMTNTEKSNEKMLPELFKTEIINIEDTCECFENKRFKSWIKFIKSKSHQELKSASKNDEKLEKVRKEAIRLMSFNYVPDLEFQERMLEFERRHREQKTREKAMTEGLSKGLQQGLFQGIEQANYELAKKMLSSGEKINKIIEYTSLPKDKINSIKKSLEV